MFQKKREDRLAPCFSDHTRNADKKRDFSPLRPIIIIVFHTPLSIPIDGALFNNDNLSF